MENNIPMSQNLTAQAPTNSPPPANRRGQNLPPFYEPIPLGVLNPKFPKVANEEIKPNFEYILQNLREMFLRKKSRADFNYLYGIIENMKGALNSFELMQTSNLREINRGPGPRRRKTRRNRRS
jgi:hypothetical protein